VLCTLIHVLWQRVTSIQFDKIHVPFGERECVDLQRSQDSGVASTSEVTVVFVDTELQPSRMNLYKQEPKGKKFIIILYGRNGVRMIAELAPPSKK